MKETIIALVGAAIGGVLGFFAFFWVASQGFYGMIIPGGLLGLGASFGKVRSIWLALLLGLAALALGFFTEWRFAWKREPLFRFLGHAHELGAITLLMIAAGGFLGFFVPFRRMEPESNRRGQAPQVK
jgi:hypothetical protein